LGAQAMVARMIVAISHLFINPPARAHGKAEEDDRDGARRLMEEGKSEEEALAELASKYGLRIRRRRRPREATGV